eukprot:TRINITY_DN2487_c0_g1_i1.p1 TRINITY_DN2487_c0_g1~~TRINITY_DN2487_c0_g1_i1.p1  ORF type:complete len:435 (-),score=57.59 TRINITY_DN2487_c0_g1_i1:267-1571(-)
MTEGTFETLETEGGIVNSADKKRLAEIDSIISDEEQEELDNLSRDDHLFENTVQVKAVYNGLRRNSLGVRLQELKERGKGILENGRRLSVVKESEKIKFLLQERRKKLAEDMQKEPFLRLVDRIGFTVGLLTLCVTEYFLLRAPEYMYLWYSVLIFPLIALRFVMYHRLKYHYFMLDFCYYCQVLLLFYLFGHQSILGAEKRAPLFKAVFALSTGPLAMGTVVWRNSLVFHDVDKLTSAFIHLCPPLVTFCLRWYPIEPECGGGSCKMTLYETFVIPMYLYLFWQLGYYIKTELVDRKKLQSDQEIMTSLRWLSEKQPHPVYLFALKCGYKGPVSILLMITQIVYTLLTLIAVKFVFENFLFHSLYLLFIFVCLLWNGASYYFEVFSESYTKRFNKQVNKKVDKSPRKIQSFETSCAFFVGFFVSLWAFLRVAL